ncbi:MAG: NADH-quinone oxidoreductase subunit NuoK [Elusimicrobiota bacterium]
MIPLSYIFIFSSLLFVIGVFGAISRRNIITVLMSIELMFNAANVNLVAVNRIMHPADAVGQVLALFAMTVATAEVVVGLALVLAIYRKFDNVFVERFNLLRG